MEYMRVMCLYLIYKNRYTGLNFRLSNMRKIWRQNERRIRHAEIQTKMNVIENFKRFHRKYMSVLVIVTFVYYKHTLLDVIQITHRFEARK